MTINQARDRILDSFEQLTTAQVQQIRKLALASREERRNDPETFLKCPRCFEFHTIHGNFDNLCDPCQQTILEHFPNHPSVPFIKEALKKW